jgi:DNA repair protein RadD
LWITIKKLREVLSLKDAHVMRVDSMELCVGVDKRGSERLEVRYYDVDANVLKEFFYLNTPEDSRAFYFNFMRLHNRIPENELSASSLTEALELRQKFRSPVFVIARKQKNYWKVCEKIFA